MDIDIEGSWAFVLHFVALLATGRLLVALMVQPSLERVQAQFIFPQLHLPLFGACLNPAESYRLLTIRTFHPALADSCCTHFLLAPVTSSYHVIGKRKRR